MLAWSSPFAGDFNQAVKPIDRDQFQCCEKVLNHTQNRPLCHFYYNMPWERNADIRGGVIRKHADWVDLVALVYFAIWEG